MARDAWLAPDKLRSAPSATIRKVSRFAKVGVR